MQLIFEPQMPHIKEVQMYPARLAAFMLAEVSFLVALTSSDNGISTLAAKGLRVISHAERIPYAPVNPYISDEDKSKRNPIYEQLGDPRAKVVGKRFQSGYCPVHIHTLYRPPRSSEENEETNPHAHFLCRDSSRCLARML